jgi:hypothetical protein
VSGLRRGKQELAAGNLTPLIFALGLAIFLVTRYGSAGAASGARLEPAGRRVSFPRRAGLAFEGYTQAREKLNWSQPVILAFNSPFSPSLAWPTAAPRQSPSANS